MNYKKKRTLLAIGVVAMLLPLCTMCRKGNGESDTDHAQTSASADTVEAAGEAYVDKSGNLVIPQRRDMDVNDYAGVLGDSVRALEDDLRMYAAEVDAEVTIVTMADIASADPQKMVAEIARRWGVGKNGDTDKGVVMLLVPNKECSQVAIYVGDQLKNALSSRYCRDIITDVMTPKLKAADYYGAVRSAVEEIVRTLSANQP